MRCTRCGTEAPPTDTDEPVDWAAWGPNDEGIRCPERISGAHQQATEVRLAPPRLGQRTEGKVRERLRLVATGKASR